MENFVDKVAIVTGSGSGIGASISKELAKRGCIVIGLGRRMEKLQTMAEEISKMKRVSKGTFYPIQCDISDEEQIEKTMNTICNDYGIPYIIVNNAGTGSVEPFPNFDSKSFDAVINTNVKGLILIAKIAVNRMIENSINGHIININSLSGYTISMPHTLSTYGGSKSMGRVFSQGIRDLIAKNRWNIKVTDISPGLVQSEMTEIYCKPLNIWDDILTSDDLASACITVLDTPPNVLISELLIQPLIASDDKIIELLS